MAGFFNKLEATFTPLAKSLERKFGEAYQIAGENLGFAKDVTALPEDYLTAERRVAALRGVVETLVRAFASRPRVFQLGSMMRNISMPRSAAAAAAAASNSGPAGAGESGASVISATDLNDGTHLSSLDTTTIGAAGLDHVGATSLSGADGGNHLQPQCVQHVIAKTCYAACETLTAEDILAAGLRHYGEACEQLGDLRLVHARELEDNVVRELHRMLSNCFAISASACNDVIAARRRLDAAKNSMMGSSEARSLSHAAEVTAAEDKFIQTLQVASEFLKGILENGVLLRRVHELLTLEHNYYKSCSESLAAAEQLLAETNATHAAIYGDVDETAKPKS